jgi:hypothetical protein
MVYETTWTGERVESFLTETLSEWRGHLKILTTNSVVVGEIARADIGLASWRRLFCPNLNISYISQISLTNTPFNHTLLTFPSLHYQNL